MGSDRKADMPRYNDLRWVPSLIVLATAACGAGHVTIEEPTTLPVDTEVTDSAGASDTATLRDTATGTTGSLSDTSSATDSATGTRDTARS